MKTLRHIVFLILAFCSWVAVSISGETRASVTDAVEYVVVFFLALAYAQWYLRRFLVPLDRMTEAQRQLICEEAKRKYKTGFFGGSIGLGYFLAITYALILVSDTAQKVPPAKPDLGFGALFFIVIGAIGQSRSLASVLADKFIEGQAKIEQDGASNRSKPVSPGTDDTPSAAGSGG